MEPQSPGTRQSSALNGTPRRCVGTITRAAVHVQHLDLENRMKVRGRGVALSSAALWSPSFSFMPSMQPLDHTPLACRELSMLFRGTTSQAWRISAPSQPRLRRSFIRGVDAARATSAGLEEEEGAGDDAAPRGTTTTEEERNAEILRQINQSNYLVGSKMMTISSFGPDFEPKWSSRTPERGSTTASAPPEKLPAQVIEEQNRLYQKRKWRLIGDNVFLSLLGTCGAWCASIKAASSFGLGAVLGTAYLVLLSRFVESLGRANDSGGGGGGGGSARLATAVLLVLIVSKNKETFDLLPALAGFLTYQVSSLVQGVYTDFDELEDEKVSAR